MTVHNYALFFRFWIPTQFFEGGYSKIPTRIFRRGQQIKAFIQIRKITLASETLFCGADGFSIVTRPARINTYSLSILKTPKH
ncbi:MAG TPA: hypothetical protein VLK33_20130, partial [Terriglobales bacterium]|nr:hypothetical protein [Terriglobales bacterium]